MATFTPHLYAASLTYTPNGGVETTINLSVPLGILRELTPSRVRERYDWWASDLINRRVVSIGSGVREIVWGIRLDDQPVEIMAWLEQALLYDIETTYTVVSSGNEFPFHVVEIIGADPNSVPVQLDRALFGANQWEVAFRARRIDGGTFDSLLRLNF